MTEAFEKLMNKEFPNLEFHPYCRTGALWAAKAIKSNPGLLWPEGEPWMSDEETERIAELEGPEPEGGAYAIRDKAQWVINAMRKHAAKMGLKNDELDAELTRLRGELEDLRNADKAWASLVERRESELDKAKERVRELEGKSIQQSSGDRYPMCQDQPAQIDCRITECDWYTGNGVCSNVSPAITLRPSGFTCWSKKTR